MALETMGYVIRSGNGYLFAPESLQMISNSKTPDSAALEAKRYASPEDAKEDMERMESRGMDVELVELQKVPYK